MSWQPVNTETNKALKFATKDWPILINGAPKAGASFFTVALTAELIRQRKKVVFMCAKGEAIRALKKELNITEPLVRGHDVTGTVATSLSDMQLVTLFQQKSMDMVNALRSLEDWNKRMVVMKNVEDILTPELWVVIKSHKQLVLSGDFSRLNFEIDTTVFRTAILFSPSPEHWKRQRSQLPTYIGDVYQGESNYQTIVSEERI